MRLWVYIDEEGVVRNTKVVQSSGSGYPALDEAAEAVMRQARFKPAINRDQRVPVWVQFPLTFQATPGQTASQVGRISGTITSAATGRPLENARITVDGMHRGAVSRRDGRFVLANLASGTYSITVQREGYGMRTISDVEIRAGETSTIEVSLMRAVP